MALRLLLSNRPERLSALLADSLQNTYCVSPQNALAEQIVIVSHLGMAHWLKLDLARRLGICAALRFPFPASWLWELHEILGGEAPPERDPFTRNAMRWRLFRLLPDLLHHPELGVLQDWLQHKDTISRRHELCDKLAEVYDSRLVYRPDTLKQWESANATSYHHLLWSALVKDVSPVSHRASRLEALSSMLDWADHLPACPPQVRLFGISSLPQPQLEAFALLARHCEVSFYCLGTDQRSSPHNNLGAWLGEQSTELQKQLIDHGATVDVDYDPPTTATQLGRLQNRLQGQECSHVRNADDSILIHVTHSPLRELQALREYLLERFDDDPTLEAGDVLVLMPDPAAMEWAIRATFSNLPPEQSIPWRLADTVQSTTEDPCIWLQELLKLLAGRLPLREVLGFLRHPYCRQRFLFSDDDLDTIGDWLEEAGLRWGADTNHRTRLGLPASNGGTWQAALDRLALSLAMPCDTEAFGEILAAGDTHSRRELFDRLAEVDSLLQAGSLSAASERSLLEWCDWIEEVGMAWLPTSLHGSREEGDLRNIILELRNTAEISSCITSVPLSVVQRELPKESGRYGSWLRGELCFAGIQPMRHVPVRVLCLLGLNQDSFPRRDTINEMMPITKRRPGERSRELEDRQILLESLLSVHEHLLLSYQGRSTKDDSELPPSPCLQQIQDYLQLVDEPPITVRSWPLQRISPWHFQAEVPRSRDTVARKAAVVTQQHSNRHPFVEGQLEPLEGSSLTLTALQNTLRDPLESFLRLRFGMILPRDNDLTADEESFSLEGLTLWQLRNKLLQRMLQGNVPYSAQALYHAGLLPVLPISDRLYQHCISEIGDLIESAEPLLRDAASFAPDGYYTCSLRPGSWMLEGRVHGLCRTGLLCLQAGAFRPRQQVQVWLQHLMMTISCSSYAGLEARILTPVGAWHMRAVENALEALNRLLSLSEEALQAPKLWLPDILYPLAEVLRNKGEQGAEHGLDQIASRWDSPHGGIRSNAATRLIWGDTPPFEDSEFRQTLIRGARALLPMLEHLEEAGA